MFPFTTIIGICPQRISDRLLTARRRIEIPGGRVVSVKSTRMNNQWLLVFASALVLMTSCSERGQDDEGPDATQSLETITGEVFYRERRFLPPGAELHITLEDVSEAGAPATVVATSTKLLAGAQPYRFELDYLPADIDPRKQYTLRATITFYGELLLTSATRLDPFRHPEDTISIRVTMVGPPEP